MTSLPSGKTPATNVEGHKIQKPRELNAKHDREVTRRNDEHVMNMSAADNPKAKEIEAEEPREESPKEKK